MKLLLILALIISVNNHGSIPADGMDLTINEVTVDPLSGERVLSLDGTLICEVPLTVTITRSEAGIIDQFCCGQCINGNGETTEELNFTPGGMSSWYIHYSPVPNSDVQINYFFSDGSESRELRVHYVYSTEGVEHTDDQLPMTNKKILQDGHIYIVHNNQKYQIL